MSKVRVTVTLEHDVLEMAKHAAHAEGASVSAVIERAVRMACGEYVAHEVRIDLLERDTVAIRVNRRDRCILSVRTDKRGVLASVDGSVGVRFFGPVDPQSIAAALRASRLGKQAIASGRPVVLLGAEPYEVVVDSFTIGLANAKGIAQLVSRAAKEVSRLGAVRFGEISRNRCAHCGGRVVAVSVWAPHGVIEEEEWTCALGHASRPSSIAQHA